MTSTGGVAPVRSVWTSAARRSLAPWWMHGVVAGEHGRFSGAMLHTATGARRCVIAAAHRQPGRRCRGPTRRDGVGRRRDRCGRR